MSPRAPAAALRLMLGPGGRKPRARLAAGVLLLTWLALGAPTLLLAAALSVVVWP